jgi:L-amino acid N-acyltransferase YncA
MAQTSLLARSGLWRLSRHELVRQAYQHLDDAGIFLAQLDRFERATARLEGVSAAALEATTLEVVPATDRCPEQLSETPLAPSDRIVLARRAGETVGWCCLSDRPVYVPELHRRVTFLGSYLWRLYVTPAERERGIGTALIRRAIEHSRTTFDVETMTALVAPDNLPSRKAFRALGFTPTTRYTSCGCLDWTWHRRSAIG